jgi:hypothetical protein
VETHSQRPVVGQFALTHYPKAEKEIDFLSDFPNVTPSFACRLGADEVLQAFEGESDGKNPETVRKHAGSGKPQAPRADSESTNPLLGAT